MQVYAALLTQLLHLWSLQVFVPDAQHMPRLTLRVLLPPTYPSETPPVAAIIAPHLSDDVLAAACHSLESQWSPGKTAASSLFPMLWKWKCGCVAVWLCGYVAVWLCGYVAAPSC